MKNTRAVKRSESIDEIRTQDDETSQAPTESIVPRRSRRTGLDEQKDGNERSKLDNDDEEETGEQDTEEEITRCICGQTDFPGPNDGVKEMAKGTGELLNKIAHYATCNTDYNRTRGTRR